MITQSQTLQPGEAELVNRARQLGPALSKPRIATADQRGLPTETIHDLVESGVVARILTGTIWPL